MGCLSLSLVDIHKKRLRKKRRLRHSRSTTSTATSATTTTFHSSSSGFARLGSSASSSASRSILSSESTRGRKYRRRNVASSVGTNSTYCGASGATNNNSLVLVDEGSNQNPVVLGQQIPSTCVKLTKQGSVGMEIEGNNNSVPSAAILLKSPKLSAETKTSSIGNLTSSDSLIKLNSPCLQRKLEPISTIDGNKIVVVDKNLQIISAVDSNGTEKCNIIQHQKQAIQMNVLGLGTALTGADEKELLDPDEIKIDYRFDDDKDDQRSKLGMVPSKVTNELEKDQKLARFSVNTDKKPNQGKSKFHRYISMDMEGEEEFFDDELAIDDDDYEHDYDDHDDYIDDEDDDDDDDGEEVYHVGNLDEMEYLENITSCNKVENVVMLSEYEQNLIKECEDVGSGSDSAGMSTMHGGIKGLSASHNRMYKTKSGKKWTMFHGQKNRKLIKDKKDTSTLPPRSSETLIHKNKKWNQVLPGPSRTITTIEENSSS